MEQFHRNFDLAVSQKSYGGLFLKVKSESEGIRLVKETVKWLLEKKDYRRIVQVIWISGCKYLGYKMGQNYSRLPLWLVQKCTMNATYWEKNEKS